MLDTITRMWKFIPKWFLLVIALAAVIGFAIHYNRKANARASADRIISGKEQATEEQIYKIINRLVAAKSWTRYSAKLNTMRVEFLCNMRHEMRKSQLQAHSVKVREQADRIISGKEQATEEQIYKIINRLSFPESWPQRLLAQDRQRLQQLQDMHSKMVKSRVKAYFAKLREQADRIISGKEQATRKQITEIITSLQCARSWPEGPIARNYQLIQQLHKIRDEMVTPHD
ncbi:hypothetical protein ES703_79121 [subsurface metagenome]